MAVHVVTGYGGDAHVSSADVGRFNLGTVGSGRYVLQTGSQLAATISSANSVSIAAGDVVMDGRHIEVGAETVTIQSGTVGKYRKDLIALKYKVNNDDTETGELIVITGTEASTAAGATEPSYTAGNIANGSTQAIMPLWAVHLTGVAISEVVAKFDPIDPLTLRPTTAGLQATVTAIEQMIANYWKTIYPVGAIYMSANNTSPASLFGGTWVQLKDRFLLGAGDTYTNGTTGGAATHTITEAELPAHTHGLSGNITSGSAANHAHAFTSNGNVAVEFDEMKDPHNAPSYYGRYVVDDEYISTGKTQISAERNTPKKARSVMRSAATSAAGAHTHTVTLSGNTGSKGSGSAANIMPPYLTVFIWKRTA